MSHANALNRQQALTEGLATKWGKLLEGVQDPNIRRSCALVFENAAQNAQARLEENTNTGHVGTFTKYIFPILRKVFPNLIAHNIMSVQPMNSPLAAVYYYDLIHGSDKGTIADGDAMISTFSQSYSSEYVAEESVGTGNGAAKTFSGILKWIPIHPYSSTTGRVVNITDGVETFSDNGSGTLTGDDGGSGTINYVTGEFSVTFNAAPANDDAIVSSYYYKSEANPQVPEVRVSLTSAAIQATSRKLKAVWSVEAAEDIRKLHGIELEQEVVASVANEIGLEIDREMIDMLISNAATTKTWTYTNPSNSARELDAIRNLVTTLSGLSAKIHRDTKRAPANFIVTTPEVVALLDQLSTHGDYRPLFVSNAASPFGPADPSTPSSYGPVTSTFGVQRVGVLANKWMVYQDPYLSAGSSTKTLLLGLKGNTVQDAGAVYAPYIPLEAINAFTSPDDLQTRVALRTRYGAKVLRSDYYATVAISGLPVT